MRLTWKQLPLAGGAALKRSSNSLAIIGDIAYVFGGEQQPRTPVDDELWAVDLRSGRASPAPSSVKPSARVGSGLVANEGSLILWGGREGQDMSPCTGDVWVYDIEKKEWTSIPAASANKDDGAGVEERSYHVLTSAANQLFLHAGCPAKGRLATLHSLPLSPSLSTSHWTSLSSGPEPGRGGTVLCPLRLKHKSLLVRYGGFAGLELGSTLDIYDIDEKKWSTVELLHREGEEGHPMKRSVHALVPVEKPMAVGGTGKEIVAVMVFGERQPAPKHLGHMGAGQFHSDAWALVHDPAGLSAGNVLSFEQLDQDGIDGELPEARGWFASGWWPNEKGGGLVVQGGLDDKNERLGDLWVGTIAA